ncbi:unnamed protein product [Mytilus coruscus]|uniref:Ig-like domain-containing protein n=1 Tax=Mytilus coruscus TaxID=42192 RepID=A0A6J8E7U2_MYTCO|nr:unnamed protein product [Mytilus coruscus]
MQLINVTTNDTRVYSLYNETYLSSVWNLKKELELWFINQTDTKIIVGQEGTIMEINCSSDTSQYITALKIESNDSIKAIGDNQFVSFSFIPDRTDHLTKYKCVDITHAAIMIEVELIIRYTPAVTVRYTNETIECDCNGYPAMYSVYRLDQISKYGKIVRSINLNTDIFAFTTFPFPYQRNGIYMCVVSNGIPDTNGNVFQTLSTNVKYEGPPVFAPENRNVKSGVVGQSITLSFHIYSYPDIEDILIETIGRKPTNRKEIKKYNVSESTLLYTEFENLVGIEGYEILIESEVLSIDDFQAYRITAKNRLGEDIYHFEIIDNACSENLPVSESKRRYFLILCCIATILFVYLIICHVYICVKHIKTRNQRHNTVEEDENHHTYHEIGTISYHDATNSRSSDTIDNVGQTPTQQQASGISTRANLQSTDENTTELNADLLDDELQQREVTVVQHVQRQQRSISSDDTNLSNVNLSRTPSIVIPSVDKGVSSDQKSQSSNDSDSETSNNVMIGNVGDGYENPYQTVLQDCPETHQYIDIIRERHNNMSSAESNSAKQTLEKKLTKKAVYINLQL